MDAGFLLAWFRCGAPLCLCLLLVLLPLSASCTLHRDTHARTPLLSAVPWSRALGGVEVLTSHQPLRGLGHSGAPLFRSLFALCRFYMHAGVVVAFFPFLSEFMQFAFCLLSWRPLLCLSEFPSRPSSFAIEKISLYPTVVLSPN